MRAEARRIRHWPFCFKAAALLLTASLLGGQWWQQQTGGAPTNYLTHIASIVCPAAAPEVIHLTVADGARVLDQLSMAATLDWYNGGNRCSYRSSVPVRV